VGLQGAHVGLQGAQLGLQGAQAGLHGAQGAHFRATSMPEAALISGGSKKPLMLNNRPV